MVRRAALVVAALAAGWVLGALTWLGVAAWFAYREFDE